MSRFADFNAMVALFMQEYGFTASYIHTLSSIPNDATGGVDLTTVTIPINAIRMEQVRPLYGVGTMTNSLIQEGDLILYVQPTEKANAMAGVLVVDPTNDKVIISGITWNVVTVKHHAPDPSDVLMYELYIRK